MFPNAKFIYLMRNPYTVFESTRNFFTNTIQPLKLEDISPEALEQNVLSIYAKLYHKYEADKQFIPEGNLMEVKFEDFEADAFCMRDGSRVYVCQNLLKSARQVFMEFLLQRGRIG